MIKNDLILFKYYILRYVNFMECNRDQYLTIYEGLINYFIFYFLRYKMYARKFTEKKEDVVSKRALMLIGIEFKKNNFKKINDIKQYVATHYHNIGLIWDFKNDRIEDKDKWIFQLGNVYQDPL